MKTSEWWTNHDCVAWSEREGYQSARVRRLGSNRPKCRSAPMTTDDWRHNGVRVIPADQLDPNTAQTPGMERAAAIDFARVGARKIWAGTVTIHPNAKTGAHHHGALESVIYVIRGRARMRWGDQLEFVAEAGPGDFIFVPPYVPHQEINAGIDEPLECVLVRSDSEAVVVDLDIEPIEKPEAVHWIDPIHHQP
ncbi:putative RmlC-like cupin family protein [Nocardia fluminea]|uniref:Putative RmlC-like cupin family protein n=2 Tax=Nocardia fluminea TaxID=134984 RepID=A0A2N3WVY2_9NOCA|nr:putative RmlC-like cupin family protein [Nocardia fluminea]